KIRKRSRAAAAAIERGMLPGAACREHEILGARIGERLACLDQSGNWGESLEAIAIDACFEANEARERTVRVGEMAAVLVVGVVTAFVILASYNPMFHLPSLIR